VRSQIGVVHGARVALAGTEKGRVPMKVQLSKTDPILITARIGTAEKPVEMVVTHDDYSEQFVLLSRAYKGRSADNEEGFDLVWKGSVVAVLSELTDIVGDALTEQFGFGAEGETKK
jgi:hypothetical protein